jgi:hypothetical protein
MYWIWSFGEARRPARLVRWTLEVVEKYKISQPSVNAFD